MWIFLRQKNGVGFLQSHGCEKVGNYIRFHPFFFFFVVVVVVVIYWGGI